MIWRWGDGFVVGGCVLGVCTCVCVCVCVRARARVCGMRVRVRVRVPVRVRACARTTNVHGAHVLPSEVIFVVA